MRRPAARDPPVIRVDALWLAVEPLDMRAGTERRWGAWCVSSALRARTTPTCSPTAVRVA